MTRQSAWWKAIKERSIGSAACVIHTLNHITPARRPAVVRFSFFFFSSRRRHTRLDGVTGVQTCALPIFQGKLCLHPGDVFCRKCAELSAGRKLRREPVGKCGGKPRFMRVPGKVREAKHSHGPPRTHYAGRAAQHHWLKNPDGDKDRRRGYPNCGSQTGETALP